MINKINSMFYSAPIYHLLSGSIQILDKDYLIKYSNEKEYRFAKKDLHKIEFKNPNMVSNGNIKFVIKHNQEMEVAYIFFNSKSLPKMKRLFTKIEQEMKDKTT